jgi:hypothetical protein
MRESSDLQRLQSLLALSVRQTRLRVVLFAVQHRSI